MMLGLRLTKKLKIGSVVTVLIILTLFRFWLGIKTPVLLQASAKYDDYLYIEYASNMLRGEWLGDFSHLTLLKAVSPAVLLVISYGLGISYPVFITMGYIAAVLLLSYAMYRLMGSRRFAIALYLFLLYSPGMFHEENVQKVYRGGYIIIFALLVFAAVIGQHAARNGKRRWEFTLWTILGCISLPIFYYLKEDSIWILPFVCGGMVITLIDLWRSRHTWKQLKFLAVLSPLFVLLCVSLGYKFLNYHYYGEYTITDRSDTNFKEVLSDLLQVDDGVQSEEQNVWVTRHMVSTAAEHSETLEQLLPYIEQSWNGWFGKEGEASGDFYIWAFRDAVRFAGVYDRGGSDVNAYYKQIHMELQKAYDSGELKALENRIYISSVTKGFTFDELAKYYGRRLPEVMRILTEYQGSITTNRESTGNLDELAIMSALTGTHFRWSGLESQYYGYDAKIAAMNNGITAVYQKTGRVVFWGAILGILLLFLSTLFHVGKGKASEEEISILLVTVGIIVSVLVIVFAVTWFCNFLSDRKLYDYLCAAIPLMETAEIIGWYYLVSNIRKAVRKIKGDKLDE